MSYKKLLLEEIHVCLKHLNLSYNDIMIMPTYERRFHLITLQNTVTETEEKMERQKNNTVTKTGKFTQSRTL